MKQSAETNKLVLFVVLAVVIIGGILYYFNQERQSSEKTENDFFNELDCDNIFIDVPLRNDCFSLRAQRENNVTLCGLSTDKDDCYVSFSSHSGNRVFCAAVANSTKQSDCLLKGISYDELKEFLDTSNHSLDANFSEKSLIIFNAGLTNSDYVYCDLEDESYDSTIVIRPTDALFNLSKTKPISAQYSLSQLKTDFGTTKADVCKFHVGIHGNQNACSAISSHDFGVLCNSALSSVDCNAISNENLNVVCQSFVTKNIKTCETLIPTSSAAYVLCIDILANNILTNE